MQSEPAALTRKMLLFMLRERVSKLHRTPVCCTVSVFIVLHIWVMRHLPPSVHYCTVLYANAFVLLPILRRHVDV